MTARSVQTEALKEALLKKRFVAVFAVLAALGLAVSASADNDKNDKNGEDKERKAILAALNTLAVRLGALQTELDAVKKTVDGLPTATDLRGVARATDLQGLAHTTDLQGLARTEDLVGVAHTTDLRALAHTTDLQGVAHSADLLGLPQNWDKVLVANDTDDRCHSARFTCIMPSDSFPDGAAVRDNVTGLVWQRSPSTPPSTWAEGRFACGGPLGDTVFGGWRMPSLNEMSSLLDFSVPAPGPVLPPGHPFVGVNAGAYWTATTDGLSSQNAWDVFMNNGQIAVTNKDGHLHVWCVRSPDPVFTY